MLARTVPGKAGHMVNLSTWHLISPKWPADNKLEGQGLRCIKGFGNLCAGARDQLESGEVGRLVLPTLWCRPIWDCSQSLTGPAPCGPHFLASLTPSCL